MDERLPEGVFWEGLGMHLRLTRSPPEGGFDLLDQVVWGTTGARFRIPGSRHRVGAQPDVAWVAMEEGDNLWFRPGGAGAVHRLLEGALHAEGQRIAPVVDDPKSPVWQEFRKAGSVGWLAPFRYGLQVTVGRVDLPTHHGPLVYTLNGV